MRIKSRSGAGILLVTALLVSACSDDDDGAISADTSSASSDDTADSAGSTEVDESTTSEADTDVVEVTAANEGCEETFYVPFVFHVPASIPFIKVIDNGLQQAAKDFAGAPYCIKTEFLAPDTFDTIQMAQILETALAKNPAALVVSYPDKGTLEPGIQQALDAGIPVITTNTGASDALALGVLAHVGEIGLEQGAAIGRELGKQGATKILCVNGNPGTSILEERCDGIAEGVAESGGTTTGVAQRNDDPIAYKNAILAALLEDPDIDAIAGIGSPDFQPAVDAAEEAGRDDILFGTFDFEPGTEVLDLIRDGKMAVSCSQAAYLQGYQPIQLLANYLYTGLFPGVGSHFNTGGFCATLENIDIAYEQVAKTN